MYFKDGKDINDESLAEVESNIRQRLSQVKKNLEILQSADNIFTQEVCDICFATAKEMQSLSKDLAEIKSRLAPDHPFRHRFEESFGTLEIEMKNFERI